MLKAKLLLILLTSLLLTQCHSQDKKTTPELKAYTYKNDKRTVYGLDVTIPGPYEAYMNDVLIERENETGMHNTLISINQAILKSGTYSFRIIVYPEPEDAAKGGIDPKTLFFLKVGLSKYDKIPVGEGAMPDTYEYIKSYPIEKIDKRVPYYEVKGEFTVELPYEMEGWSKGQDLRKMDKQILQQKVVAYYQKLWDILNDGDGEKWGALTQQRRQETIIFNYSDEKYVNNIFSEEAASIKERKNRMAPLEDYTMKIYGNGKLVTLERIHHTKEMNGKTIDAYGESPLIRNGKTKGVAFYSVKLYLPKESDELVIIRK
ncbi:hypothetical protein [Flavobacterium chilense]|uniref:Uncharacterized protein n=1 Tax=Flavobacterium chilense TaxID=946677 RepID=A0A1M7DSQ5_9FLAO|nr:hypothetical protein [Flavobacterium chilense]SHL82512.1 hypothetical protein SAMN05444484_102707 [Flavobacterium chilense]